MPNWCDTSYTIVGEEKEINTLYGIMKKLQDMKEPSVNNGFGTSWLGCLVDALGEDWRKVYCRGEWTELDHSGCAVYFTTMTAWAPCNEVWELVKRKFPSIDYYYLAEEGGCGLFQTNDAEGEYYPERFVVNLHIPNEDYRQEYFETLDDALAWIEKQTDIEVRTKEEVKNVQKRLREQDADAYCFLNEFELTA